MMGNRGSANGIECDAFSRRSRGYFNWKRGQLRKIKRQFSKRMRKVGKLSLRQAIDHR
ncbi:hypothetical protein [Hyphomicrobium sp.]|uniref:hypothetical protein n=1 Tax=Hyphomicrobium sp. TaxID=82 RepID=UPI002C1DB4EC|nr:hypothetical protein [Hyphomicrobium sp.]HRQ25794.1 hypothetical protein [Hyphomicrobium sp.]